MHSRAYTRRKFGRAFASLALAVLAGCRDAMYDQPRYDPFQSSAFFADGTSARPLEEGTVPHRDEPYDVLRETGKLDGEDADLFPFPITRTDLERGRERYIIFCTPCHGARGDGRGMIVERGLSPPPSFFGPVDRRDPKGPVSVYADLRQAPVGHFFEVITNGHGAMYSYASRVPRDDRWRIAAYIRALQLSGYATADDLAAIPEPNEEERALLKGAGR